MRNKKTDFDTTPVCPATPAADERAPVAPKAKQCVACEGATSGDNVPCAVCGADPAPQPNENPLSDEYVNVVIRGYGYGSPECVIARLHQWIGLHGGKNNVTLLMYEAHKALVKLRTPVADERAAFTAWLAGSYPSVYSEPEAVRLWHHGHVAALAWQERGRRAALASAPVAGEAQADDLNKKLFEAAILDLAAISEHLGLDPDEGGAEPIIGAIDELRRERDSWVNAQRAADDEAAPQASPAADGKDSMTDAARDVISERQRQITAKSFSAQRDDGYLSRQLADAAAHYALKAGGWNGIDTWPWPKDTFKLDTPRRMLVKAGALILAEIERLDRAAIAAQQGEGGGV